MTIDEAIKSLQGDSFAVDSLGDPELRDAMKLSIEALKWRQEVIRAGFKPSPPLLPGETKDPTV